MAIQEEVEKFKNYIDTQVIADIIFDCLKERSYEESAENAKIVWGDILEHLYDLATGSLSFLPLENREGVYTEEVKIDE